MILQTPVVDTDRGHLMTPLQIPALALEGCVAVM